ncbi:MAG: hypothetical protein IJ583_14870, partial [Firmicutes bacterium]|nr:hypothetical protein [Bacillota bacterium]
MKYVEIKKTTCCAIIDEYVYLYPSEINILICLNTKTGNFEIQKGVPNKSIFDSLTVVDIININNKLIFVSHNNDKIWAYDPITIQWNELKVEFIKEYNAVKKLFSRGIKYNNYAIFIGFYQPIILIYDIEADKTVHLFDLKENFKNGSCPYFLDCEIKNNRLYVPLCFDNKVLII